MGNDYMHATVNHARIITSFLQLNSLGPTKGPYI